ncbi:MAG TPA: metalloregulator ArsR/SmtB family transcription factor [Isosphaeraceae bacterium]
MAATRGSRTKAPKTAVSDSAAPIREVGPGTEDVAAAPAAEAAPARPARRTRSPKKAEPAPRPPGPSPEVRQAAMLLKQAADPTRLQVLLLLAEQERNVSTLCADLGHQSQPAVSHHLALLRHGRLIEPRRQGKNNVYSLTEEGRKLAEAIRSMAS